MGLFRKGKTCIVAKFHRTDLVIYSHSGEGKALSYSQINIVDPKPIKKLGTSKIIIIILTIQKRELGCGAQWVECLTQEPEVPGSIPGLATYFHFSFP